MPPFINFRCNGFISFSAIASRFYLFLRFSVRYKDLFTPPPQMPYLLDLHLFLGRPLKIAGDDVSGQAKYAENEDGVVGTVPEPLMVWISGSIRVRAWFGARLM